MEEILTRIRFEDLREKGPHPDRSMREGIHKANWFLFGREGGLGDVEKCNQQMGINELHRLEIV